MSTDFNSTNTEQRENELEIKIEATEQFDGEEVNTLTRFIHFIIDSFVWLIIAFILMYISTPLMNKLWYLLKTKDVIRYLIMFIIMFAIIFVAFFGYYFIMEESFQKTVAKFITRTKVVANNGNKPKKTAILKRTFCRLIPFADQVSFLFTRNGLHDKLSGTIVIKPYCCKFHKNQDNEKKLFPSSSIGKNVNASIHDQQQKIAREKLSNLTVNQLKEIAKQSSISYSKLKKTDLIQAIIDKENHKNKNISSEERVKFLLIHHPICRNCGEKLQGQYCHKCGQDGYAGRKRDYVDDFLWSKFSLDSDFKKLFKTVNLLCYPGKLTKEYYEGRIIRYVSPFTLFWFINTIFCLFITFKYVGYDFFEKKEKIEVIPKESNQVEDNSLMITEPVQTQSTDNGVQIYDKSFPKISNLPKSAEEKNLIKLLNSYDPYIATFLMIPVFAFLMFLFFSKNISQFHLHMIFSLHYHTFLYLYMGILNLFVHIFPFFKITVFHTYFPFLYLIIAIYVFYKPKDIPTFIKKLQFFLISFTKMLLILLIYGLIMYFTFELFKIFFSYGLKPL